MTEIVLGKTYRDKVSGMEGVALCRSQWMYGCERITLQPAYDKTKNDGKMPDMVVFDAPSLELVRDAEPVKVDEKQKAKKPAGPRNDVGGLR